MSTDTEITLRYWATISYGGNRMVVPIDVEIHPPAPVPGDADIRKRLTDLVLRSVQIDFERN